MSQIRHIDPTPHIVACMIFLFLTTLSSDVQCTEPSPQAGQSISQECQNK